MYFCITYGLIITRFSYGSASFSLRRPGWLDKVVVYHRNGLFDDFKKLPAVEIKATLQPMPPGYVDSSAWNYDSVIHLLSLIRESETARPVRRALQRLLNGRRMTFQEKVAMFPSLSKGNGNNYYYDVDSGEYYGEVLNEEEMPGVEEVIVVSNPVESRLPSGMISVSLLREILESRAKAARYMPTTRKTIPWKTTRKMSTSKGRNETTATTSNLSNASNASNSSNTSYPSTGETGSGGSTTAVATGAGDVATTAGE